MKLSLKFVFYFTCILAVCACGKLDNFLDTKPYYPRYYYTYEKLPEYSSTFETTCSDTRNCTNYTGTLLTQASITSIGSCTAFLIAPNRIMTNSHCIPNYLKQNNPIECSNSIIFLLPQNYRYASQKIKCKKVLYNSKPNDMSDTFSFDPDYAVIELEKSVNRPVAVVSNEGLNTTEKYEIYKSNNYLSLKQSSIEKIDCAIHPLADKDSMEKSKNTVNGLSCITIKGNSGSPLVSSNTNNVVAILFGGSVASSYVTNFMCLEVKPISSYVRHSTCP